MFEAFVNNYLMEILAAILTAVAAWLGAEFKKLYKEHVNTKVKKELADTVVQFVEQVYHNLHGEEKLNAGLAAFSDLLAEKGITVSDIEMRILLEASVAKFNDAFNKKLSIGLDINPATATTE